MYILLEIQSLIYDFNSLWKLGNTIFPIIKIPNRYYNNYNYASLLSLSSSSSSSSPLKSTTPFTDSTKNMTTLNDNEIRREQFKTKLTIDDGNATFTEIFMKHVIPSLYNMYINLQQRKGWAQTYNLKKKISLNESHQLNDCISYPKRLTPITSTIPPKTPTRVSNEEIILSSEKIYQTPNHLPPTPLLFQSPSPIKFLNQSNPTTPTNINNISNINNINDINNGDNNFNQSSSSITINNK